MKLAPVFAGALAVVGAATWIAMRQPVPAAPVAAPAVPAAPPARAPAEAPAAAPVRPAPPVATAPAAPATAAAPVARDRTPPPAAEPPPPRDDAAADDAPPTGQLKPFDVTKIPESQRETLLARLRELGMLVERDGQYYVDPSKAPPPDQPSEVTMDQPYREDGQ